MAEGQRPFSELRDSGLLWLINTTILHPRGYALAIHFNNAGEATGWSIEGDGTERWAYASSAAPHIDELFLKIKELLP